MNGRWRHPQLAGRITPSYLRHLTAVAPPPPAEGSHGSDQNWGWDGYSWGGCEEMKRATLMSGRESRFQWWDLGGIMHRPCCSRREPYLPVAVADGHANHDHRGKENAASSWRFLGRLRECRLSMLPVKEDSCMGTVGS